MAIGDINGDTADTYATLGPRKQTSFDATNTPAKYLAPPPGQQSLEQLAPPAGPIGRAQQQLPASQPNNLGNIDLTPLDPVSAAQQPAKLTDALPGFSADQPVTPPAQQAPQSQPNNLGNINLAPLDPVAAAQSAAPSNLANAFPSSPAPQPATAIQPATPTSQPNNLGNIDLTTFDPVSAAQQSGPSNLANAYPVPPTPQPGASQPASTSAASPPAVPASGVFSTDPLIKQQQIAAWKSQSTGQTALSQFADKAVAPIIAAAPPAAANPPNAPASPTGLDLLTSGQKPPAAATSTVTPAATTPAAPATPAQGPVTPDQYQPTGASTDANGTVRKGGQIVAKTGPNGEASFSNAPTDQAAAQNLGDIINNPAPPTAKPGASLASLGSAANLGDGVGTFSQAEAGDAALSMGRFQKAQDLRDSYKSQDRLEQAQGEKWQADHTNVVHDTSHRLTASEKKTDDAYSAMRDNADKNVGVAQGLVDKQQSGQAVNQQLRQGQRLEDAYVAATAPNATPEQHQQLQTLVDPTGTKGIDRQLKVATIDEKNASAAAKLRTANKAGNLPVGLQKLEDGDIDAVSNVQSINTQMGNILGQIDNGSLVLGPVENRKNAARNSAGISTPESANYASFMSSLEKIRNDSLRLNKGPQTEGDAQRAWAELLSNVNDPKVVKQRLGEIQVMNNKAAQVRLGMINSRRKNQGVGPLNVDDILGAPPQASQSAQTQQRGATASTPPPQATQGSAAQPSVIPQIQNDDDFNNLPSGAQFIDPKGNHRRKP
ncbi:hypothetical protein [Pseudomonas sp.]|uniref:hypothetical protein n=1 Tax=Pseudomonas sp. TaxID=306 RepID=UPI00263284EB|nr:hypothetical protein [Pseudomonas sp.]